MDDIVYQWLPSSVEFEKDLELPQFELVDVQKQDCSQNYTTGTRALTELHDRYTHKTTRRVLVRSQNYTTDTRTRAFPAQCSHS